VWLGFFILQRPLPYGWAVAVEIAVGFKASELQIAPGSVLSFTLSCGVQSGVLVEGGNIYRQPQGGFVYKDNEFTGRVVPVIGGLKVEKMVGGMIHGTQKRVYEFLGTPDQYISGLLTDTPNQKITLSRDGVATFRGLGEIQSSESLLALVSTETGESKIYWGSEINLSSQGITAMITYPNAVISSHENGGKEADFNILLLRFYLSIGSTLYRQTNPSTVITGSNSQSFSFPSLTGFGSILSEPLDFISGLYDTPLFGISASSGSLSGIVKIGVSYVYNGSIVSSISQKLLDGCIPILDFESMTENLAKKWAIILG